MRSLQSAPQRPVRPDGPGCGSTWPVARARQRNQQQPWENGERARAIGRTSIRLSVVSHLEVIERHLIGRFRQAAQGRLVVRWRHGA